MSARWLVATYLALQLRSTLPTRITQQRWQTDSTETIPDYRLYEAYIDSLPSLKRDKSKFSKVSLEYETNLPTHRYRARSPRLFAWCENESLGQLAESIYIIL